MALVSEKSDRQLLELLSRGGMSMTELTEAMGVTPTAVRQRLDRLAEAGCVDRVEDRENSGGRGRPAFKYVLTEVGRTLLGNNLEALAVAMWSEIREIDDPRVREQIVRGTARRMLESMRGDVRGRSPRERLQSLAQCLSNRELSVSLQPPANASANGEETAKSKRQELPMLVVSGCPYPGIADDTRHDICEMEQVMFSELVGQTMVLKECKCHSANGTCTFVVDRESSRE
jgi:predicted ArsR family transcriptional regulator